MIKTALSRRLVTSLFCSRQQQQQPKRLKSTTDDDFGDLKSVKHIPSVTFDEASDDFPAAKAEDEREPVMIHREDVFSKYKQKGVGQARQVWVESLDNSGRQNKDLLRLHPDVWSVKPRLDILWQNINWQKRYRRVDFDEQKDRWEMHYGGRPWPQKGTGKARHASKTSPIWHQGGKAHPNFGIRGHFYMLPVDVRIQGLTNALSAKLAQDDLRVVSNLDVPSTDPDYIEKLIDDRGWGLSALISDVSDIFPEDITAATEPVQHVNLMPCYGLNVHSILKHKTLVLTVDAVNYLEDKLLYAMSRVDYAEKNIKSSTYGYSIY